MAEQSEPDYRFTLANERTFLAYIRTALALDAAGLAVAQFVRGSGREALSVGLGALLTALGALVAVVSYQRWAANRQAMREGQPLPTVRVPITLTIGLAAVSVAAFVLVVLR